ncbi:MAG: hypothetical protein ACPMAG_04380 [Limisphaerales bacterium]
MNKKKSAETFGKIILLILLLFSVQFSFQSFSANSNQAPNLSAGVKSRGRPFHGTIKAVDYSAEFIVLQGKSAQTFYVDSKTAIKIDGKPAKLRDIVAGNYVGGYAREQPDGKWVATTLNIDTTKSKNSSPNK